MCPHPPYSPDLAPCDFWLFPKVKMIMKGKGFESIQDIEAATTAQLKTRKRTSRTASKSGKNDGISVFEARGSILRGINGNVSFSEIFFLCKHSPYFLSHLVQYNNGRRPMHYPAVFSVLIYTSATVTNRLPLWNTASRF